MNHLSGYSKIYTLGHRAVSNIFNGIVIVEEKIDGSQFSAGVVNGELLCRSHNTALCLDAPNKMFVGAINTFKRLHEEGKLHEGWVYRGECLAVPKHNVLKYDRVPVGNIILFDIDTGIQCYFDPYKKRVESERLGLECVPMFKTSINSMEEFISLLDNESVLGGATIEGIVIKNYDRFDQDGKTLMAKHVSERFKEQHHTQSVTGTHKGIIEIMCGEYCSEARWQKALQHLREIGEIHDEPKDIASLFREVNRDVLEECGDEIKERLFKQAWKDISRSITRGLPEWYKNCLLAKQFDGEPR